MVAPPEPPGAAPVPGRQAAVAANMPRAVARIVLLAEQHLVGQAVRVALASRGIDAVSVAWTTEALGLTQRRIAAAKPRAGLVVGDLTGRDRRDRAAAIVATQRMRWLLLVTDPQDVIWGGLLTAGVAGIRPTSIGLDDLVTTLGRMMSGREMMERRSREEQVRDWQEREVMLRRTAERITHLTPRELAVLGQLYEGMTVSAIAESAGVSEGTVRSQVKAVLRKLEVNSQLAAVAAYRQVHGLLGQLP